MKPKTAIGLLIVAGAGLLAWTWWKSRTANSGRTIPQPSGFDYAAAIPQQINLRTVEGQTQAGTLQIVGNAVPRPTCPDGYTYNTTYHCCYGGLGHGSCLPG